MLPTYTDWRTQSNGAPVFRPCQAIRGIMGKSFYRADLEYGSPFVLAGFHASLLRVVWASVCCRQSSPVRRKTSG